MIIHRKIPCLFLPLACLSLAAPAAAETADKSRLSAELSAGVTADSDVGLADLDQSTRQGDLAAIIGLKLDAETRPADKLTLRGGYELSDTRYQDFGAFNLQTHRLSADAEYDFGATTAGVLYNYVDARLDGDGYLTFQQAWHDQDGPLLTFNPEHGFRRIFVKIVMQLQDESFACRVGQLTVRCSFIDRFLKTDMRPGFDLQIPAAFVLVKVIGQRSFNILRPRVVAFDQV